ncbi:MAG: hypothetical protein CL678_18985 [Bdellovibrionaceae bacterium]|nr:hypothetical protein [Pseudobdellovibrionaceae bacterium]|tara:strand:- start:1924 stop:2898 length:975 start_codon:yes stop_codon:yes gene_type:complete
MKTLVILLILFSGIEGKASPEALAKKEIQEVLHSLRSSDSLRQFNQSSRNFETLSQSSFTQEFQCKILDDFKEEDLILLEEWTENLPCSLKISEKIENYWSAQPIPLILSRNTGKPTLEKVVNPDSGPIYSRGELQKKQIAITFDDGPHRRRTPKILDILSDFQVRATFFNVGENIRRYPDLSLQAANDGHSVGTHTDTHPRVIKLPFKDAQFEILNAHESALLATGSDTHFFRFPYGEKNKQIQNWVREQKFATFFWNMDSLDWKITKVDALYENVIKEIEKFKGGIILFHDIHEQTVRVLPRVLQYLEDNEFETVVFVPSLN